MQVVALVLLPFFTVAFSAPASGVTFWVDNCTSGIIGYQEVTFGVGVTPNKTCHRQGEPPYALSVGDALRVPLRDLSQLRSKGPDGRICIPSRLLCEQRRRESSTLLDYNSVWKQRDTGGMPIP